MRIYFYFDMRIHLFTYLQMYQPKGILNGKRKKERTEFTFKCPERMFFLLWPIHFEIHLSIGFKPFFLGFCTIQLYYTSSIVFVA